MDLMKHLFYLAIGAPLAWGVILAMTAASDPGRWSGISGNRLLENIKVLSSDEFEGRAPASKGEKLATEFIEAQFKQIGLKPGNPDGTYFQKVPLVGISTDPSAQLVFTDTTSGRNMALKYADEFVAWTPRLQPAVEIDADMIFVGYGVVAPEYHWDDYKGLNVKGKVLVMLINDPPVPDPSDPSQLDEKTFKGKAMTYYGRWTYKFEIAAEKGAVGCLIVHQTGPAGYPWSVVKNSNTSEHFDLVAADKGMSRLAVEGWITHSKANELFALAGKDLASLEKAAVSRDFRPVDLHVKASLSFKNKIRTIESKNVVAKLTGADPKLRDQYVIYTAHWDHLGIGPEVNGDKIYHGAIDNASGVAGLLEVARAYTAVQPPPRRSILFLSVTAEEKGLLGSRYYAQHPLYPLARTLAEINMDGLNMLGRTKDIEIVGLGQSTLDDIVQERCGGAGKSGQAGCRARKRLLLSLRPLQLRPAGSACARSRFRRRLCRQAGRLGAPDAAKVDCRGLPQALG